MIAQLRIDERLIHGQITTAWSRALNVDAIVVANDANASSDTAKQALIMSAQGANKKVAVKTIVDAISLLKDPRSEKMKILLLADCPKDAIELVKALKIDTVNVGNYVKKKAEHKIMIVPTVTADEEDQRYFEELCNMEDTKVISQVIPTVPSVDFYKALKKAQK